MVEVTVHIIQGVLIRLQAHKLPVIHLTVLTIQLPELRLTALLIRVVVGILTVLQVITAAPRPITLPILPPEQCPVPALYQLLPVDVPAGFTGCPTPVAGVWLMGAHMRRVAVIQAVTIITILPI